MYAQHRHLYSLLPLIIIQQPFTPVTGKYWENKSALKSNIIEINFSSKVRTSKTNHEKAKHALEYKKQGVHKVFFFFETYHRAFSY